LIFWTSCWCSTRTRACPQRRCWSTSTSGPVRTPQRRTHARTRAHTDTQPQKVIYIALSSNQRHSHWRNLVASSGVTTRVHAQIRCRNACSSPSRYCQRTSPATSTKRSLRRSSRAARPRGRERAAASQAAAARRASVVATERRRETKSGGVVEEVRGWMSTARSSETPAGQALWAAQELAAAVREGDRLPRAAAAVVVVVEEQTQPMIPLVRASSKVSRCRLNEIFVIGRTHLTSTRLSSPNSADFRWFAATSARDGARSAWFS
jgi:hypothetical protein